MHEAIFSRHFQSGLHIPAMCHKLHKLISHQLIVGMFRKLLARVIKSCSIQNCIHAFFIENTFLLNRKNI